MATNWQPIDDAITTNLHLLQKPGVLTVRPGFKIKAGKLTKTPAVVATVTKKGTGSPANFVPEQIGQYPTDVRQATTLDLLRQRDPQAFEDEQQRGRAEFAQPTYPYERDVTTGTPVATRPTRSRSTGKPQWPYQPPSNATLDPVTDTVSLVLHASPDAGWLKLSEFLKGTQRSLTVGMYDFTSAHVLAGVSAATSANVALAMVLDHPAPNPSADQSDEQTHIALASQLHDHLDFAWAAETRDPEVTAGYFPNAYHIKVAVRDSDTFWLSSGNWNNSNQPDINPFADKDAADPIARGSDRDWHVIVSHAGLAQTFEAYLRNDLDMAKKVQVQTDSSSDDEANLSHPSPEKRVSGKPPATYFQPLVLTDVEATIQPVLTPDTGSGNYVDNFLKLINSATQKLYIQTQYIHPPQDASAQGFTQLLNAVVTKMNDGVDVKIILSQYEATGGWLERLQDAGFDISKVRIQHGVHNKGFVVDSKVVAIGSQNWSADGVLHNRDASLIIQNDQAAQYFEQIFEHDWDNLATPAA